MRRSIFSIIVLFAAVSATGCASIVNGQNQSLSVKTNLGDTEVVGAKCSLVSNKGTWLVTTPGSVTVQRSFQDLVVTCKQDNMADGTASVKSSTKAMAFGNILFGGIIGAAVDTSTGAAYDYPTSLTIAMGKNSALGGPADKAAAAAAATASASGTPNTATPTPAGAQAPAEVKDTTSINARQNPFADTLNAKPPAAPAAAPPAAPTPAPSAAPATGEVKK